MRAEELRATGLGGGAWGLGRGVRQGSGGGVGGGGGHRAERLRAELEVVGEVDLRGVEAARETGEEVPHWARIRVAAVRAAARSAFGAS